MRRAVAAALGATVLTGAACGGSSTVTFNKDVAPVVYANCAPCHRPGEAAPFPLLTYADVSKHADEVVVQTRERRMPPWPPEPGEFAFQRDRHLRDDQIALFARWVKDGALEGKPSDLPKAPEWTEGWQLGKPDAIATAERPYLVKPSTEDVFRNLVLHVPLKAGVFVRAVEFKTNGAPIHHAVIRVDRTSASRRRDGEDGQPGFEGMAWENVQDPDGQFVGWAPGRGPILAPDSMPWRLDRGADLVVEVHVMPSAKPLSIQPTVGLFFTETPPVRTPMTVRMGSKQMDIPAGVQDYAVTDEYALPVAIDLLSVYPHAHYLGKDMRLTAALPDGSVKTLIHIKQWSFHWQQDYRFVTPVSLPAGTKLTMRYTYDNSDANEENPHHPPVRVRTGPKSTDEMADLGLQLLTRSAADAARLAQSFDEREKLANIALAESRVREEPTVAEYQALLGGSYVEVGRFADAIPRLEEAIRLKDKSASTYNYLGVALMSLGRVAEALAPLRVAESLSPRDERMPFDVGAALGALGRTAEAAAAYARALAINPDFPDAHANLGQLMFSRGQTKEALAHFERAAELKPDSEVIHNNLGSALAASGRFLEALQHVQRALQLNPGYEPAQDNLKRLNQMGIR